MSFLRREEYKRRGFRKNQVPFSIDDMAAELQKKSPVVFFAFLFGSAQNGIVPSGGDIDIAAYFSDKKKSDWDTISHTISIVESFLNHQAECDIIVLNNASLYLKNEAIKGICLFVRPEYEDLYCDVLIKTQYEMEEAQFFRTKYEQYKGNNGDDLKSWIH
ncbi:MAG: nucleotidyltransferase domain-containing protein [Candidatus Magnetomorum sp.]|nr:nucleotidyltransferase domain-containing protein [Candidatus Magnetomorum sp.]